MTDEAVASVFAPYGSVVDARVLVSAGLSPDGNGQSVAIVRMDNAEEAAWIVDNLNGNIPVGLSDPVEVSYAGPRSVVNRPPAAPSQRSSPYGNGERSSEINTPPRPARPTRPAGTVPPVPYESNALSKLYVKNLPSHANDLYLYKVFSPFGCVLNAKTVSNPSYVIGFVQYSNDHEAAEAIRVVNGQTLVDGTVLHVSVKTAKGM